MRSTIFDADALYDTIRNGPAPARVALLNQLPDSGFGESTLLLQSEEPGMIVCGMLPAVMKLCAGIDPAAGAPLALATHRYAVETFEADATHGGLVPMTLSNLAFQYANACNLLGDSAAAIDFADRWVPYYTQLRDTQNLPSLKTARINALINLHRLDEAAEALGEPTLRGNPATDIEIARLEKLLRERRGDITTDPEAAQARREAEATQGILTDEVKRALAAMAGMSSDDPSQQEAMKQALEKLLGTAQPSDPNTAEGFDALDDALKIGEAILTGWRDADSELTVRQQIRRVDRLFAGGRRPGPQPLRNALTVLKPCLQWATQHGHAELKRDALWRIYLCHSRLDEPSQAADAALALRADLEQDRAGIADPLKRGGVFSSFKYLFPALCEKLQLAGRPAELLEAIEASKGRGVADILTAKSGRPVADASIYAAVARLPELTRRHQFHYATFNVDDERTYVGFVSKTGEIHAIPPVPLGRAAIRDAALQADPRTAADTARRLAPLVQWIDRLQTEGVIDAADHLCYAPDDDLSNVPFHYLLIDDEPLINRVSLSRIHSAFHLAHVLERDATPPAQYLALVVPTRQNTERDSWTEMARFLREPVTALARLLRGETVEQLDATLEFMRRVDLRRQVLHFSAHGVFPPPESGRAPFAESGVVLSSATGLPDADRIAAGDLVLVLTPSRVLDWKLDLSGSHVSIMTCVSGLSREGLGGDALGLDWAFTQAGAASLVTSHWNVNAKLAASFLSRFYDLWLGKRMPRGRALAHVMRSFREQDDLSAEPHVWAAFSLTGDWR